MGNPLFNVQNKVGVLATYREGKNPLREWRLFAVLRKRTLWRA
jgi:hypothetical protein